MVHASHNFYLKFFLDRGINVFTWNYRGYGKSSGTPSPTYLKSDAQKVYSFLRTQMKLTGKIGVYGRSLGGVPASHISNLVDLCIIDRSFSNFKDMAVTKY